MTAVGLFLDGPKAGETMVWPFQAPRSFEYILPRRLTYTATLPPYDAEPVSIRAKTVTYKPFMVAFESHLYLYSCGPLNPWETLTDVLAPLLKLARAETERQLDYS